MRRIWNSKYGKPGYITREGYFHLFNGLQGKGSNYVFSFFTHIPTHIRKYMYRLRETIIKLKISTKLINTTLIITIFKAESKLSRKAYINLLITNLL